MFTKIFTHIVHQTRWKLRNDLSIEKKNVLHTSLTFDLALFLILFLLKKVENRTQQC